MTQLSPNSGPRPSDADAGESTRQTRRELSSEHRAKRFRKARTEWDALWDASVVRVMCAILAIGMGWMAFCHSASALGSAGWIEPVLDSILFVTAVLCAYLLAVVAILGRSWRRALPYLSSEQSESSNRSLMDEATTTTEFGEHQEDSVDSG